MQSRLIVVIARLSSGFYVWDRFVDDWNSSGLINCQIGDDVGCKKPKLNIHFSSNDSKTWPADGKFHSPKFTPIASNWLIVSALASGTELSINSRFSLNASSYVSCEIILAIFDLLLIQLFCPRLFLFFVFIYFRYDVYWEYTRGPLNFGRHHKFFHCKSASFLVVFQKLEIHKFPHSPSVLNICTAADRQINHGGRLA